MAIHKSKTPRKRKGAPRNCQSKPQTSPTDFVVREASTPWTTTRTREQAPSVATKRIQRQFIANKSKHQQTAKRTLQHDILVDVFRRINASIDKIEQNLDAAFHSLTSSNGTSPPKESVGQS